MGNVLQNKGGIGAYVRVDRTTFLFVAAHLAAHQASKQNTVAFLFKENEETTWKGRLPGLRFSGRRRRLVLKSIS